jgi:hypothetical protein
MEQILEGEGIEVRGFTCEQLGIEVGLEVDGKTVKDIMETMKYYKCIACRNGWVDGNTATRREDCPRIIREICLRVSGGLQNSKFSPRFTDERRVRDSCAQIIPKYNKIMHKI